MTVPVSVLVERFHQHIGHPGPDRPSMDQHAERRDLRIRLITEEFRELLVAIVEGDLTAIAHELADLVIVAYGTAHTYGIPLDEVIAAVHESNMTRTPNPDGKATKGDGYRPPEVAAVLAAAIRAAERAPYMRYPQGRPGWLAEPYEPFPCGFCGSDVDSSEPHYCKKAGVCSVTVAGSGRPCVVPGRHPGVEHYDGTTSPILGEPPSGAGILDTDWRPVLRRTPETGYGDTTTWRKGSTAMVMKWVIRLLIVGTVVFVFTQPAQAMDTAGDIGGGLGKLAGVIWDAVGDAADRAGDSAGNAG